MLNSVGPLGLSTIDEEPDFQISTCIKNPTAAASDGLNQNSRKDCLRQMPMRPSADVKASKKHSTRVTERCRGHGSLRQVSLGLGVPPGPQPRSRARSSAAPQGGPSTTKLLSPATLVLGSFFLAATTFGGSIVKITFNASFG